MTTDTPERRTALAGAGGARAAGSPEPAGTHEERRRWALRGAVAEAAVSAARGQAEVAVHPFGQGAVAVALGGAFDSVGIERLQGTLRDIGRVALRELVMDFSALSGCEPALARVLAAARMRYLVAGTEAQWHHVPPELAEHFHNNQREAFAILDEDRPTSRYPERVRVPATDASTIAAHLADKDSHDDGDVNSRPGSQPFPQPERRPTMADNQDSTTESVIGRAKEAAGAALGADSVRDEGRAQQNKADAQDEEARKEQELQQARAQRQAHESQEEKNKPN